MRRVSRVAALPLLLAAMVFWSAACAIQRDSAPRDVPINQRPLLDPVDPAAGESGGSSRIFLLTSGEDDGNQQLRSVLREVEPTEEAVLEALFLGPNQREFEAGLRTDLPDDLVLLSPPRRVAGTLNVDVSAEILELPASALRRAVAEIVFTASELEGVRGVRLRVRGEDRAWPDGRGEQRDGRLTVYDFPGLVESSQPPYPATPSEPPA